MQHRSEKLLRNSNWGRSGIDIVHSKSHHNTTAHKSHFGEQFVSHHDELCLSSERVSGMLSAAVLNNNRNDGWTLENHKWSWMRAIYGGGGGGGGVRQARLLLEWMRVGGLIAAIK